MDFITLGAFVFIVLFGVWGFFRGFWKSLAAIVSLVVAYFLAAFLAMPLSGVLIKNFGVEDVNEQVLWGICSIVLFIVISFVTRLGIVLLGRALPIESLIINRVTGAAISAAYGAALVVFVVWALSFSLQTVDGATGVVKRLDMEKGGSTPLVVEWSREIMAIILKWNSEKGGASKAVQEVTQAFAKSPVELMAKIKDAAGTGEFRQMMSDPELIEKVKAGRFEEVKQSRKFKALMGNPTVKSLQEQLTPSGHAGTREELVDQVMALWQDVLYVRDDPEVESLLNDPEVQRFIQGDGSQVSLSLLGKARDLLSIISSKSESHLPPLPKVYKWRDDRGVINITEWEAIPAEKRKDAESAAQ